MRYVCTALINDITEMEKSNLKRDYLQLKSKKM